MGPDNVSAATTQAMAIDILIQWTLWDLTIDFWDEKTALAFDQQWSWEIGEEEEEEGVTVVNFYGT